MSRYQIINPDSLGGPRGGNNGLVLVPDELTRATVRSVTVLDAEGRLDVTTAVTSVGAPVYGVGFALVD